MENENMVNNFDNAKDAFLQSAEDIEQSAEGIQEENGERRMENDEQNVEGEASIDGTGTSSPTPNQTEQALQAAEAATQALQQRDNEMRQILGQNQEMQRQLGEMQEVIRQLSEQNQQGVIAGAYQNNPAGSPLGDQADEFPILDIAAMIYDDPETIAQKQRDYSAKMAAFAERVAMKKMEPYFKQTEQVARQNERNEVINELSKVPELEGFTEMLPQIEKIIQNNDIFQNSDNISKNYITAYAIAKGVNSINSPQKQPTTDELMEIYNTSPQLQKEIEKARIQKAASAGQPPAMSASSGAVNAALNIPSKPTNFDEAKKQLMETLKIN